MTQPFDYFVVLAEMRTGSNFLESNLNAFDQIECFGEAFNPHFPGYPNKDELLGVTLAQRTADPMVLLSRIKAQNGGIGGFRFFHDHDPRVLDICLNDPRCAKVILTRNPVDSFVSWKIAQATGQWKLTDVRRRKDSKVRIDPQEFKTHMAALQDFQVQVMNRLQRSGQTGFYIAYEDLQDLDVLNGMARFLGIDAALESLNKSLKPQNPGGLTQKVSNFSQLKDAMVELDQFNLSRTPNFEPRRGPLVPRYLAAPQSALLFQPMPGGPDERVCRWLSNLDDGADLIGGFNQKTLRRWKSDHKGHRSFTVLRHPVARAHAVFCEKILNPDTAFGQIRRTLRQVYKMPIPAKTLDDSYDSAAHRAAFLSFLEFVKANLLGQTSIRQDACWATQASVLKGFAEFSLPDMIIRENEMTSYLPALAVQVGRFDAAEPADPVNDFPHQLADIYDAEIEELAADIYQRDYLMFGFDRWA